VRVDVGTWAEVEHTADRAVWLRAESMEDLLATAASALYALLTRLDAVRVEQQVSLRLAAPDAESLLVDWLNELLYYCDVHGLAFVAFRFERVSTTGVEAVASGGQRGEVISYIKAATYHNLEVRRTVAGFEATVVFDM